MEPGVIEAPASLPKRVFRHVVPSTVLILPPNLHGSGGESARAAADSPRLHSRPPQRPLPVRRDIIQSRLRRLLPQQHGRDPAP